MSTVIETARLRLRPLTLEDAPSVRPLLDDPSIARELPAVPFPLPDGGCEEWIAGACEDDTFAMERRSDGKIVGAVGLHFEPSDRCQVAGWVGRPYRHEGYAVEAMRAAVHYGYAERDLRLVYALRKGRLWVASPDGDDEHMPFHNEPDGWHLLDQVEESRFRQLLRRLARRPR